MTQLTIEIKGLEEADQRLATIGKAVLNLQDAMSEVGDYLTRFFSGEVFISRGRVIGHPWAPLKPDYAVEKARDFPGRPPLIRSGLMNKSFKHRAGRLSARIYNTAPYFDDHQLGRRRLPQRVMMHVDDARAREIVGTIGRDISARLRAAG